MNLSKKKFSFERKKIDNTENYFNNQYEEKTNEINLKNKYFSQKNLFLDEVLAKEKNLKSFEKESEASESPKFSKIQVTSENLEVNNISNNPKLEDLLNQNEDENIDFINTLLKLKGIKLNQLKNYNSSKNLSNKIQIKEENNLVQKLKKKVIIRNDKNNQSNSSNQTTKINSINNNQQNENEEDEISKNFCNITSSAKEINNDINEISNDKIEINNKENIKFKSEKNSIKREVLTFSNRVNNAYIERKPQKKEFESKLKKEWSFKEKNGIIFKKLNNKNNCLSSKDSIKNQEKINSNLNINEKINIKKNYIKIPKGIERLYLNKMNISNYNDKSLDNTKTDREREGIEKYLQNINYIKNMNEHQNHTINNVYNNNIMIKKPKVNRKIVKRQKSMFNKIKKVNEIKHNNIPKIIKDKEFNENKTSNNIISTNYKIKTNNANINLYKECKTESKREKDNVFNFKKVYKVLERENKLNSEHKFNQKKEYKQEYDLKVFKNPLIEKKRIYKQNLEKDGTNFNKSNENLFPKFAVTSERKIKIYPLNNPNFKNYLNKSPNKSINLFKRNIQKYKYIDDINSYSKIAINKMISTPSNKKETMNNINRINNIDHNDYYKKKEDINIKNYYTKSLQNPLCSLMDKTANSSNSIIFKKLNEIPPSEDENLNNTTEMNNDEFNDEGINEINKNDNIKYKKVKKAEIFLFDNAQD